MTAVPCQLPYPQRYEKALEFYNSWPPQAKQPSQETLLLLYALSSQVAKGPCKEPRPSSWNPVDTAKWTAWEGLKDMDKLEAMRLFLRTLEEDEPAWYSTMDALPQEPATDSRTPEPAGSKGLDDLVCDGTWLAPWVTADKHPHPRFEHSACLLGSTMYVFGGNCAGGRYLDDVWQLNLDTLSWHNATSLFSVAEESDGACPARFPACAGSVALPHRGRVLIVGGHTKGKDRKARLAVRVLDPARSSWSALLCEGPVPLTRGSHAAAIIGDKVYVVGGEGPSRQLLDSVQVLDLATNTWGGLEAAGDVTGGPSPRSAMAVTAHQDRYLVLFGGGSVGQCHNDLWVLDTATGAWEKHTLAPGPAPSPRAGCCSALLGNRWYILGGGNNAAGCPDMWVLDLSQLGVERLKWERVCDLDARSALASEGASLVASPAQGALIAFGGYNGAYHNAVSVFKPAAGGPRGAGGSGAPEDVLPRPLNGAGVAREPEIQPAEQQPGHKPSTNGKTPKAPPAPAASHGQQLEAAHKATTAALEEAAMAKEAMAQELSLMRNQLSAAQSAQQDAESSADELRAALAAEKDRAFKLEVQVSELSAKLQTMDELELEVNKYKALLADKEKSSGGIWGYISGAS